MSIDLKIAQLRKLSGVSQQELAQHLGVTFQSVSKWETKTSLPDIGLLPDIASFFQVSVDEVLGLAPIRSANYIPRNTDDRERWENRRQVIENDRQMFWNDDYLNYLVSGVWKIDKPVDIIEFCCCNGDLGKRLMRLLPKGSTYTGVDSEYLINEARKNFCGEGYEPTLIASDVYSFQAEKRYDMSICQAALRHMNQPVQILENMKNSVKMGGLVVTVEINREIENVGLYMEGVDYDRLCTSFDWRKLWLSETANEGRDYAIGFKAPFYMERLGLKEVDVRMNDKVTFVTPSHDNYRAMRDALAAFRGWDGKEEYAVKEDAAEFYMSRGFQRSEVESLYRFQKEMADYMEKNEENVSFLHIFGFLISYGRR